MIGPQVAPDSKQWLDSSFLINILETAIDECKVRLYLETYPSNVPEDIPKAKLSSISMAKMLDAIDGPIWRKQILKILSYLIPKSINGFRLFNVLVQMLLGNSLIPLEHCKIKELKTLTDVDFLKSYKNLTEIANMSEEYVKNTIIYDAVQEFKRTTHLTLAQSLEDFKAEIRGNWMRRAGELSDEVNRLTKLNRSLLKDINTRMPNKIFCTMILRKLNKLKQENLILYTQAFTYGSKFMKKTANKSKRTLNQITKLMVGKIKGINIQEELDQEEYEKAKKDGSIWYPKIMEIINKNDQYRELFNRVPLLEQPKIMENLVFDMPKLDNISKIEQELTQRIDSTYNKTIKSLGNTINSLGSANEWEEIEEDPEMNEMTREEAEMIGTLLEEDSKDKLHKDT